MESCGKEVGRSGMAEREGIEYTEPRQAVCESGEEDKGGYRC